MTEKSKEKEMPFLDHLEELRWRLIKSIVTVIACAIGVYFFSEHVLGFLIAPYNDAAPKVDSGVAQKLIFLSPTGGFMIRIKISIFAAILLGLPVIFYQIWQFVVPGLLGKEKKLVPVVAFFSTLCFLTGALFCYFVVLRFGLRFLLSFETKDLVATISVNEYLGFVTMLILVFGFIFELPILALFLTKIGFLTPAFMRHYRRHGIVGMVILSAVVTPPDVFTQLLLAGPLILLYEISILISAAVHKKQEVA